jgi:hypothetical protein
MHDKTIAQITEEVAINWYKITIYTNGLDISRGHYINKTLVKGERILEILHQDRLGHLVRVRARL